MYKGVHDGLEPETVQDWLIYDAGYLAGINASITGGVIRLVPALRQLFQLKWAPNESWAVVKIFHEFLTFLLTISATLLESYL